MLKKALLIFVFGIVLVSAFAGCSRNFIENPYAMPPRDIRLEELNRTQYEVLEKTQGSGTASMIGLWPLPIWWTYSDDGTVTMWGTSLTRRSTDLARNRAITIAPRADDLFSPIAEHKKFNAIWFKTVTTTVKGKVIVVKTDEECRQSGGNCWSSIMPITARDLKP